MSDTDQGAAAPESTDKLTPQEESRVSAALAIGAEQEAQQAAQSPASGPPPAADAQSPLATTGAAGVETPPDGARAATGSGDAPPETIIESKPQPFDIDKTVLIEHPVQGAAVERGTDIPPPEAEPIRGVTTDPPNPEPATEHTFADNAEHPRDTIARLRAKLDAYGSECLKAVQPEIEYLISLCEDPVEGAGS